jgi:ribosomal protein L40E
MVKFPEAQARLFRNKFACKRCKSVIRSDMMKIMAGKAKCKKCGSKVLRPLRKK